MNNVSTLLTHNTVISLTHVQESCTWRCTV